MSNAQTTHDVIASSRCFLVSFGRESSAPGTRDLCEPKGSIAGGCKGLLTAPKLLPAADFEHLQHT